LFWLLRYYYKCLPIVEAVNDTRPEDWYGEADKAENTDYDEDTDDEPEFSQCHTWDSSGRSWQAANSTHCCATDVAEVKCANPLDFELRKKSGTSTGETSAASGTSTSSSSNSTASSSSASVKQCYECVEREPLHDK
jgi:hypothetical protein